MDVSCDAMKWEALRVLDEREPMDLSKLAIHTQTNKPWSLRDCIDGYVAAGVGAISVWRHVMDPAAGGVTVDEAAAMLRDSGLAVPALVRGGFFVASDPAARAAAVDANKVCIDEAAAIGAEMVVLVVGSEPGVPLATGRAMVAEGIAACMDHAMACGVKLAIEPLHPMYAADKSCVNRLAQAREICEQLSHPAVGIAVDVYHVWWDPDLEREIQLVGQQNTLFAFHLCDWRVPTRDFLTDRTLMGEGCIPVRQIRSWVERAGFAGYNEVEIFSQDFWAMDQTQYVEAIKQAYLTQS